MALNDHPDDRPVPAEPHPQAARDFDRVSLVDPRRQRLWMWVVAPVIVIGLGIAIIGLIAPSKNNRWDQSRYSADEPFDAVGTAGAVVDRADAPPAGSLRALFGGGARTDYSQLVGQHAEVFLDPAQAMNDVAFWVGDEAQSLLVVIDRDVRVEADRARGGAGDSNFNLEAPLGERAVVKAVVEEVPYAEARASWGLTARDERLLEERGVYLRAYEMIAP